MPQVRYLCRGCAKEWLPQTYAPTVYVPADEKGHAFRPWAPEDPCPACRSSDVRRIEFHGRPGDDIPRDGAYIQHQPEPEAQAIPDAANAAILPPLVVAEYDPALIAERQSQIRRDLALPEFA